MVSLSGLREWFGELVINRGHQLKWWLLGGYFTINFGSIAIWGFEGAVLPLGTLWLGCAGILMEFSYRGFRKATLLNRATMETWEKMDRLESEAAQRELHAYWSGNQSQ